MKFFQNLYKGHRNRLLRAAEKKEQSIKGARVKAKQQKIMQLLGQIPATEVEEMEKEEKRKDRLELKEISENLWKNWRGKSTIKKNTGENK